jgi:hypothetical protein
MSKIPKSKTNYSLRRRFYNEIGQPLEWKDKGEGLFVLKTVQQQIKILAQGSRRVEIELIHNGKRLGFDGKEIEHNMIFEKR